MKWTPPNPHPQHLSQISGIWKAALSLEHNIFHRIYRTITTFKTLNPRKRWKILFFHFPSPPVKVSKILQRWKLFNYLKNHKTKPTPNQKTNHTPQTLKHFFVCFIVTIWGVREHDLFEIALVSTTFHKVFFANELFPVEEATKLLQFMLTIFWCT